MAISPRVFGPSPVGGARRRAFKASQNRRVPLWTVEPEGEEFDGVIRVPIRLCNTAEHTNARLEFDKLIVENLDRWVEWRKQRGWILSENPQISGPFDPPEGDREKQAAYHAHAEKQIGKPVEAAAVTTFDYPEEFKWYVAKARFHREEPVLVRLEDMLFLRHLALTYQVDPDRDKPTTNYFPEPKDELYFEGGLDPMKVAEERRQSLGLKRKDYLMGKLRNPL